ncbi:MAG: YceI family protein [Bacteroidota bacterium]
MAKTNWNIDPMHSEVHFKVKHMMVSTVTGAFDEFEGKTEAEDENFENGTFTFKAKTASINTKITDRDNHLKSDDFFNAEKYPEITFNSKSFIKDGDDFKLVGDLTIRDVTREVELEVIHDGVAVDPYGQTKAGFELTGKINRKEFGLQWNGVTEAGSVVVSDTVRLVLNIQLIKQ